MLVTNAKRLSLRVHFLVDFERLGWEGKRLFFSRSDVT
jgi:hypothetical protein